MHYGRVRMEYSAYMDDMGKPSKGVREAQSHMRKISYKATWSRKRASRPTPT